MPESVPERPDSGFYWVKSSLSFSHGNCVEVASLPDGGVGVRNSRDSEGLVLNLHRANAPSWRRASRRFTIVSAGSDQTGKVP
jgi:hypothetical protein